MTENNIIDQIARAFDAVMASRRQRRREREQMEIAVRAALLKYQLDAEAARVQRLITQAQHRSAEGDRLTFHQRR